MVVLLVLGCGVAMVAYAAGVRLFGLGLLGLALWLLRYDIARQRLGAGGQARYIAVALRVGFGWLGVGGGLALGYGGMTAGPYYDAILHAVLVGFVFSMVFAHALLIFPAVVGRRLDYRSSFYLPLLLLHMALVVRIAGDLGRMAAWRFWGGLANALAIVFFFVVMMLTVVTSRIRNAGK